MNDGKRGRMENEEGREKDEVRKKMKEGRCHEGRKMKEDEGK